MTDRIEFYLGTIARPIMQMASSHAPAVGDLVNIMRTTYRVKFRSWAIDRPTGVPNDVVCVVILAPPLPGRRRRR